MAPPQVEQALLDRPWNSCRHVRWDYACRREQVEVARCAKDRLDRSHALTDRDAPELHACDHGRRRDPESVRALNRRERQTPGIASPVRSRVTNQGMQSAGYRRSTRRERAGDVNVAAGRPAEPLAEPRAAAVRDLPRRGA